MFRYLLLNDLINSQSGNQENVMKSQTGKMSNQNADRITEIMAVEEVMIMMVANEVNIKICVSPEKRNILNMIQIRISDCII